MKHHARDQQYFEEQVPTVIQVLSIYSYVFKFKYIPIFITTIVFHALDAKNEIAGTIYCSWMETYQVLHLFKHFNDLGVLYFVMGEVKDTDCV